MPPGGDTAVPQTPMEDTKSLEYDEEEDTEKNPSLMTSAPINSGSLLQEMSFTRLTVEKGISRLKKYKSETQRYATKCRMLEQEIQELQNQLTFLTNNFQEMDSKIDDLKTKTNSLVETLYEETVRRDAAMSECIKLKQTAEQLEKQTTIIDNDTIQTKQHLALLKDDIKKKEERHQNAVAEEERLKLERRWFLYERILLEKTRMGEMEKIHKVQKKYNSLKQVLEGLWNDTREAEIMSQVRNTKKSVGLDAWYAARQRRFNLPHPHQSPSTENASSVQE